MAARPAVTAYIALGANLGNPAETLLHAMESIAVLDGVSLLQRSALYASAPVQSSGPDYVNAVVEVNTVLTAPDLLAQLQLLELQAGRERPYHNAPRTLDLDLLLYGSASMVSANLQLPHPRMTERAFVLLPLADIAPQCVTAAQLEAVRTQVIRRLT